MKTFVISLVIFAVLVLFIAWNFYYVRDSVGMLVGLTEALTPDGTLENASQLSLLRKKWEERRDVLGLSSGVSHIEEIELLLSSLEVYAETGSVTEFIRAREQLVIAFSDLASFESFNIFDILAFTDSQTCFPSL